jgi:hypothetical protein
LCGSGLIVVLHACTVALWRVQREDLDERGARVLGFAALIAITCAAVARDLDGRPGVTVFRLIAFVAFGAFVVWGLRRLLLRRARYFMYFAIAFVAIYQGAQLVPTLVEGSVLAALPAFFVRVAAVACLGCGVSLMLLSIRLADWQREESDGGDEFEDEFYAEDDRASGMGA